MAKNDHTAQSMTGPIVECVPNFSEGSDPEVVRKIVRAMRSDDVALLDWSLDPDHNRSVVTLAGPPQAVADSVLRGVGRAVELIDLTRQRGVHPRIGAADVVPFVPLQGTALQETVVLAHRVGREIWGRYHVPVYFYEAAATRPDRVLLENIRRGQFEGLGRESVRNADRVPDIGGPSLHPTAGACAVGARQLLVAFNVFLDTPNVGIARAIARQVRASSGGLAGVKAIGVPVRGQAQVSMNITNFRATPLDVVYAAVKNAAARAGAQPERVEIIGLVPEAAIGPENEWTQKAIDFDPGKKTLERRLESPMEWP
jgi:glutamate formiminotransferase